MKISKTFECCCQFARGVRVVALIAFLMVWYRRFIAGATLIFQKKEVESFWKLSLNVVEIL
jgi:hypothetical protein